MPDPNSDLEKQSPDHFFVGGGVVDWQNRLPDGGPRYAETPINPYAPDFGSVAEPWNTVTAAFFVLIVMYWVWKLGRRWREYPFIMACLPILLAGGIGGTLYHATRTQLVYFLLDLIPISLLGFAGSVYLIIRLAYGLGALRVMTVTFVVLLAYLGVNRLLFRAIPFENPNMPVNLSYASLAVVILLPMAAVLIKTRFAYFAYILTALVSFAIAWLCRLIDNQGLSSLPMGTHWLWHSFGALTTHLMIVYYSKLAKWDWNSQKPLGILQHTSPE
jgi:hypothetical protein